MKMILILFTEEIMKGYEVPYTTSEVSSDPEMSFVPSPLKLQDQTWSV